MDWNVVVVALETEVRRKRAPEGLLLNAWAEYAHLLDQAEPGHPVRLKKEWATVLASAAWVWLHSTDQYPTRNHTRLTCKWCKRDSNILIEITSRAVAPMGQVAASPFGTRVMLDNGFVILPTNHQPRATTRAEQISMSLTQQMWPQGTLPIPTRDAVFVIHGTPCSASCIPGVCIRSKYQGPYQASWNEQ